MPKVVLLNTAILLPLVKYDVMAIRIILMH